MLMQFVESGRGFEISAARGRVLTVTYTWLPNAPLDDVGAANGLLISYT